MMQWRLPVFGAGLAGLAAVSTALAAPPPPPRDAAVVRRISGCRAVADTAARLACYDAAADALAQAQASGDVVVVDRAQVREVRRQAFGFHLPSLDVLPRAPREAPLQQVDLVLASAGRTGDGKWVLVTQEGARWVQTDSEDIDNPPHAGSRLRVRSGALGGYFCKVDGQIAVRCQRQQ